MTRFKVAGKVRGKPRPRFSTVGGHARSYTPASQIEYERSIGKAYKDAGGVRIDGPVSVLIVTHRQLPKSTPKNVLMQPDTIKPDADNIAKTVLDGLNGKAFKDDSQVTTLKVIKAPRMRNVEGVDILEVVVTQDISE